MADPAVRSDPSPDERVYHQLLGHPAITVAGIGLEAGLFTAFRARPAGVTATIFRDLMDAHDF